MSYGLRVWSSGGALTLEVSDRISRIHSSHTFSVFFSATPNAVLRTTTYTVYVPGIANDGSWFIGGLTVTTASGIATQQNCISYISPGSIQFTVFYGGSSAQTLIINFDVMRA